MMRSTTRSGGSPPGASMDEPPDDDPRSTPFIAILLYVLGFMLALAVLALAAGWLLKHLA
jgi:hypothetical protein